MAENPYQHNSCESYLFHIGLATMCLRCHQRDAWNEGYRSLPIRPCNLMHLKDIGPGDDTIQDCHGRIFKLAPEFKRVDDGAFNFDKYNGIRR